MVSEPKIYRISSEGVERLVWRRTIRQSVLIVLAVVLSVLASGQSADPDQRLRLVIGGCVVIALAFAVVLIVNTRVQRRYWSSYRLQVDADIIRRSQEGLEPIRLNRTEITSIQEIKGTGLLLRTAARLRLVYIPVGLAGYEELRDLIRTWQVPQTVAVLTRASETVLWAGGCLLYFASWLICRSSENVAVVVQSAVLFYGLMILGLSEYQRNPNIPKRDKVMVWVCLLFGWKFFVLPFLRICSAIARA